MMDIAWLVTIRGGKHTIDPPMLCVVKDDVRKDDEVVESSGEFVDKAVKEVEIPQKVIPVPRPEPPFFQRMVKKTGMVNTDILLLCLNSFSSMSL